VQAVTSTALVKLHDRDDIGEEQFTQLIDSATSIHIVRDPLDVREVSEAEYHVQIRRFQQKKPALAAFVTIPVEADEYYLTENGVAGFAISGDELVGLFNDREEPGVGEQLVGEATNRGASRLMCFATDKRVSLYQSWGFAEQDRASWDENLAPERWDYERFGRPDVVWMEL